VEARKKTIRKKRERIKDRNKRTDPHVSFREEPGFKKRSASEEENKKKLVGRRATRATRGPDRAGS